MELKRRTFLGAVALITGFAGCLGGNSGSGSEATSTPTESSAETGTTTAAAATGSPGATGATVQVSSHPDLGDILVGPNQMTLYMFDQDTKGESASTCYDDCASSWPPLTVTGNPSAGDDVTAQLATFERETGETQVMAGGWPLYYFAPDEQPGDATGQGANDVWWVLSPDGTPIKPSTTTTGGSTTAGSRTPTGGGGGIGY